MEPSEPGVRDATVEPVFERKVCAACGSSWTAPPDACSTCERSTLEPHPGAGFDYDTLVRVREAARKLKHAEDSVVSARQAYAEAIKALSDEAIR